MPGSEDGGLVGMLLIVGGVAAVVVALGGGVWLMGGVDGVADPDYTHRLEPSDETRCSTNRPAAEQYRYGDLSPRGQAVVDRARADLGSTVTTGEPVPTFEYGTALDPAAPQYVEADEECYRLRAEQSGLGDPGPVIQVTVYALLGMLAVLGLVAAAVGTVKYGD